MPYASHAQRRLFHAKLKRGELSKKVVDEYDAASKGKKLPNRVSAAKERAFERSRKRKAR